MTGTKCIKIYLYIQIYDKCAGYHFQKPARRYMHLNRGKITLGYLWVLGFKVPAPETTE